MSELEFTDENFETEVIRSDKPVLVDFWSPNCAPCLVIAPIIEAIAKEFEGKAKVGRLNTMENPRTAREYKIAGIPTIIMFKDGKARERATGLRPKNIIVDRLNSLL